MRGVPEEARLVGAHACLMPRTRGRCEQHALPMQGLRVVLHCHKHKGWITLPCLAG